MNYFELTNAQQSSVQVIIRIQPPPGDSLTILNEHTLQCLSKNYYFDYVFPYDSSQEEVYDKIGVKMIASAKKGYNSCIFAYGQTGSGKTYTMTGANGEFGLIQRCMMGLLKLLSGFESYELKLSYFEIYNQTIYDLLLNAGAKKKDKDNPQIKIKQSVTLGFYLQNLQQITIEDENDLYQNLKKGLKNRTTAQTKMNRESSRSHSILTLYVTTRQRKQRSQFFSIKSFKMHFVDLAGSQKQKSTFAAGQRLKQASSINKSLTTLSMVIEKLSMKSSHVPYRDSVLTKILRDSLGGNSKTILIATLSSKQQSIPQSLSTIHFATKTKKVKLTAQINQLYDDSVAQLKHRIRELQQQIKSLKNIEYDCPSCKILKQQYYKLEEYIEKLENENKNKDERIQQLEEVVYAMEKQYMDKIVDMENYIKELEQELQYKDYFIKSNKKDTKYEKETDMNDDDEKNDNFTHCDYFDGSKKLLTTIMEENPQQQTTLEDVSLTQISEATFRNNVPFYNPKQKRKIRKMPYICYSKDGFGQKIQRTYTVDDLSNTFLIKELNEKIILLESQIKLSQMKLEQQKQDAEQKLLENKKIYEPIINEWVKQNGYYIKNNLRARNAVEKDLLLGMRNKMEKYKADLKLEEERSRERTEQYQRVLEQLRKDYEEFKTMVMQKYMKFIQNGKNSELFETEDDSKQRRIKQQTGYVSKSCPKANVDSKILNASKIRAYFVENDTQKQDKQLGFKNLMPPLAPSINPSIKSNNTNNNNLPKPKKLLQQHQQIISKLQQQLSIKQISSQQLQKQLQNYKCRYNQLQQQLQNSQQIVRYWQSKYNTINSIKKQLQNDLQQIKNDNIELYEQFTMHKIKKQEDLITLRKQIDREREETEAKLNESHDIYMTILSNQQQYKNEIDKLQSEIQKKINENKTLTENMGQMELNNSYLNNNIQNLKSELINVQKISQHSKIVTLKLQQKIKQQQNTIQALSIQNTRLQQNLTYKIQQFNRKLEVKDKQFNIIQKQNAKQYMEWLDARQNAKLISMKYNEIKEMNEKLKIDKDRIAMRYKDLQKAINEDQTESFRTINKLNEAIAQLEYKGTQLEEKISYMNIEFVNKVNELKYWKGEYEKQKKWSQDFKKMQEQFISEQERERPKEKSFMSTQNKNLSIKTNNKNIQSKNMEYDLLSWQNEESKRQIQEIAKNLSQMCGMQITQKSILLQLDEISEEVQKMKMINEENRSLKEKLKVLKEERNSDFWRKFQ